MRVQSWRLVMFSSLAALLVMYGVWWTRMIADLKERTATDFMAFYAAGRVAQANGLPATYTIKLQQNIQQEVLGFPLADGQVLLYNHLPYLVPVLAALVNQDYAGSFIRWDILLLLTYIGSIWVLVNSLFADENRETRLMLTGGLITFFPLFISLWQGQDTAFLFLGTVLWCMGLLKKQDSLIAIGIAFATIRPHIAVALALPILLKHQKVLWRIALIGIILALACLLIFKVSGLVGFLQLLRISAEGTWFGMKPEAMFNLLGIVARSFPALDPQKLNLLSWVIYGIGLGLIAILWVRSTETNERLLGLTVLMAILFAPHLHLHDLTLLLIPLLFVARQAHVTYPQLPLTIFLLGASFFLILGFLSDVLYYVLPYAVCLLLIWRLLKTSSAALIKT
jgi:glycosyl transferase family 87